jgi:Mn2+/Fe2+ NRAMP family transporter
MTDAAAPASRRRARRRTALYALAAVVGPGLLAGLSDDDPAGITTYSVLGAERGYQLLWVLLVSTVALTVFHSLGARMGIATGQGLTGLIRERFGVRIAGAATVVLLVANIGTTCAEFAGVAMGMELFGVSRLVSVPIAAGAVTVLVLRNSFSRVEHLLMAVSAVFLAYLASGVMSHPDWSAAVRGLVVPHMDSSSRTVVLVAATVGTTLAPWGLSFIQSYAVDKKLTVRDLRFETVDVVTGSTLTAVIGFFVIVACAATLHAHHITIEDGGDAARALEPLAGGLASTLFGVGLVGAALLAASVLPLSTAYSVCEFVGAEASVDDTLASAPLFYVTFIATTAIGAGIVLLPGAPLVTILVATQVLNAVLLLPLLALMQVLSRDPLLGPHRVGRALQAVQLAALALVFACVLGLGVVTVAR